MYTTKNMQVRFAYSGDPMAKLVHGVNNNFLLGNFGKMQFIDAESGRKEADSEYDAFRIELHYKSEH